MSFATKNVSLGEISDTAKLAKFLSSVDELIFENEFVATEAIRKAAEGLSVRIHPALDVIHQLQDKLTQKKILSRLAIPTSRHLAYTGGDLKKWLTSAQKELGKRFVIKWARLGYDGKGNFFFKKSTQLKKAIEFCQKAQEAQVDLYAEEWASFKNELAIVACRSAQGEFATYPLVVSQQQNGICLRVLGPASIRKVAPKLEERARVYAEKLAQEMNLVGTFAIELFELKKGGLWVNEIAPRVHNTGHYSQDAAETSQFENHIRAILGQRLGSTKTARAFAMLNLLGPKGVHSEDRSAFPPVLPGFQLHWYHKKEIRPGRKLGHLNTQAASARELSARIKDLENWRSKWQKSLRPKNRK